MDNSPSETPSLGSLGTSLSSIRGSKHRSNLFSIDHILSSSVAAAVAANADSNNNNPHNQHHHHLYNPLLAHSDKHLMSNTHNVDTFQQHLLQQHQHQQLLQQLQLQQAHLNRDPERDLTSLNDQLNFFNQQRNQLMAAAAAAAALAPAYQQQQQPLNPYSSTLDHHQQLLEKIKNSPPLAGTMQPQTASPDFLYLMACMFLQQQQQQQQQQLQQSHPTLRQQSPQRQQQSQHHNHHQPQHSKLKHLNQNVQQQQEATTRQSLDSLASSPMDSLAKLALFANQQQDDLTSSNKPLANKRQSQQSNAKRARPDGSPDVEFDQAQPNLTDFKSSSSSNLMSALNQSAHRSNQPLRPKSSTKQNLNSGNHLKSFVEDTRGNNSSNNNNNNTSNDRTHNNNNTISNSNINKSTSDLISSAAQALISGSNLTSATKGTTKVNSTGEALLPTPINTTLAKAPPELIKKQPAWVFCTRYSDRPSSGPRTRKKTKHQHEKKSKDSNKQANQSSFNLNDEKRPRTAFTSEQLDKLRKEFQENSYLDEKRRKDLADRLCLNENQIKIWFQNKRAKMKKQNSQPNPLRGLLVAGGLYNHSTATSDCSESYANGNDMDQDMGDQNHHQRQLSTAGNHASGQEVDDEEEEEDDNDCMDLNDPLDVI